MTAATDTQTTRIYLLRHGEVAAPEIHYGHTDVALSERGREQAATAAVKLAPVSLAAAYSSDLQRATIGASLVATHHPFNAQTDPALREMNLGTLEGVPHAVSSLRYPELYAKRYRDLVDQGFPGGGESLREVARRAWPAFERIVARHRGQAAAVVAHNSVNRIIIARALGLPIEQMFGFFQDYGCINWIDYGPNGPRVGLLNWTAVAPAGEPEAERHPL